MRAFALIAFVLGLSLPCTAEGSNCDDVPHRLAALVVTTEFDRVAKAFDANPDLHPIQFVTLDHRSGTWTIYRWNRRSAPVKATDTDFVEVKGIDFAESGVPKVALGRNDRAFFVLTNTTPPLYKLTKETTPHDIPELANLKAVLAGLETLVKALAAQHAVSSGPFELAPQTTADAITDVQAKLLAVRAVGDRVTTAKNETIRLLQYSELGERSPSVDAAAIGKLIPDIGIAYRALETSRANLAGSDFGLSHGCQAALDVVNKATKDDFTSTTTIAALKSRLQPEIDRADCTDEARKEASASLDSLAQHDAYVNTTTAYLALLAIVDQALGTEANVLANAAAVRDVYGDNGSAEPCDYITGVLLGSTPDQVAFDKFGEVKVTVAKNDVLGHPFTRRPNAEGDFTYRTVNPVSDRIGFGVAMTLSGIKDPEFKAVQNPNNADEKVIGKSKETRRAGEIALLGVYRWTPKTQAVRQGFQFGVGTSQTLELFAGYSVDLGSMFRLGVGLTGQQVNALAGSQHALQINKDGTVVESSLTKVSSDGDIQTRSKLKTGLYFSFSFSLDSLSLFEKP